MSSVNSMVYEHVTELFKLKHREALVFYKLNGFLLRNDIPFPYSAEALGENTVYSKRTIFLALTELEKLQIIERTGLGYNRRFKKGKCLKDIINMCINLSTAQSLRGCEKDDQNQKVNNLTTVQSLHRPTQSLHRPVQSLHTGKHIENLGKLKDLGAHALSKPKNQTQTLRSEDTSPENLQLLADFRHGLKYPQMQLTGNKLLIAEALYKRDHPEYKSHG